jgi:hypothetical protein
MKYGINKSLGHLSISHIKFYEILRKRAVFWDSWFMKIITTENRISGFEVNSGNVMHLRFIKLN